MPHGDECPICNPPPDWVVLVPFGLLLLAALAFVLLGGLG